ncbi:MAG: chemotaxis response regulator protein-glutamate methylesterase [Labilithrix sp.]|nr:chemotaxis response regulator protein-glutamate methylesterase [Labilithrix sp.]
MTALAKKIRVLIAEDSPTARALLVGIFGLSPDFDVVGTAANGIEAVAQARALRPDVLTMDIQMPGIDGLEATRRIMSDVPTPIVIVSSLDVHSVQISMEALRSGALAVLPKPTGPAAPGWATSRATLLATVRSMSQVRLVRRWADNAPPPYRKQEREPEVPPRAGGAVKVIGLAASTGGPAAYQKILSALDASYPVPLVLVQHIAHGFGVGFAKWLDDVCPVKVKIGEPGEPLAPGTVYIAPDDAHIGVSPTLTIALSHSPARNGFRPSASHLFESLAPFGSGAAGIILTGMGTDGVDGLRVLKKAGGYVIAQDETSSDIFGMPRAAIEARTVDAVVPLGEVAMQLERLSGRRPSPVV